MDYEFLLSNEELDMFNEMYFAIHEHPVGYNRIWGGDQRFDFSIIPLNSKFFDCKITLRIYTNTLYHLIHQNRQVMFPISGYFSPVNIPIKF